MKFCESVWNDTLPIYQAILAHPFNAELAEGSLSPERFAFYVQQDALYLTDFARALALTAARAPDSAAAESLLAYAQEGMEVERALHSHFFGLFNIRAATRQEPACFVYTQFLLATAALESYAVSMAALLPCFWIYWKAGLHLAAGARRPNPFEAWIQTYSDEAFGRSVERMIELTNSAAEKASPAEREAMRRAYRISAECEWGFWDGAYRLVRWPSWNGPWSK